MNVNIDDLSKEILEELMEGVDEITGDCIEFAKECATECQEALMAASPKDTGKYASGWTVRKSGQGYVVYNKTNPSIEMPLEHGHITVNGKNKGKRVGKRPHIYKIADRYRNMFYNICLKRAGRKGD